MHWVALQTVNTQDKEDVFAAGQDVFAPVDNASVHKGSHVVFNFKDAIDHLAGFPTSAST